MKKIFVLFSLSLLFLFTSCSFLLNIPQKAGRITVKLPGRSNSNNRGVIKDDIDIDTDNLVFTVEIYDAPYFDKVNPKYSKNGKQGEIVHFDNVHPGEWLIKCFVSVNGAEKQAYAQNRTNVKLTSDPEPVALVIEKNVASNIKEVALVSGPTKQSYELDESIDYEDSLFEVTFNNEYKIPMTYKDIVDSKSNYLHISVCMIDDEAKSMLSSGNSIETSQKSTDMIAQRFNYNILYEVKLTEGTEEKKTIYLPSTIKVNAKKPVIIKQPVSTTFQNMSGLFEFSVEVDNDSKYGDISYNWKCKTDYRNMYCTPVNKYPDYSSTNATYKDEGVSYTPNGTYEAIPDVAYYWCEVKNTDTDGINGETERITKSTEAVLELHDPITNTNVTKNYHYVTKDTDIEYKDEYYINYGELPEPSNFVLVKTLQLFSDYEKNGNNNEKKYKYYDYESYSFEVDLDENLSWDILPNSFGYLPFKVSYKYMYYEPKLTPNGSGVAYESGIEKEETKTVYIKTKLPDVPEFSYEINSDCKKYNPRYYNPDGGDSNWYYAYEGVGKDLNTKEDTLYTISSYPYANYTKDLVFADSLYSTTCYFFESAGNPEYKDVDPYELVNFTALVKTNDKLVKKVDSKFNSEKPFGYVLQVDDYAALNDPNTIIKVGLEVTKKINSYYSSWFENRDSQYVAQVPESQWITFQRY